MSANDRQVGGDHYRKVPGEQHWDRAWRLYGPAPFQYQITKYVERYRDKNGIQDLEKALHFLEKLIELEKSRLLLEEAAGETDGRDDVSETGSANGVRPDSRSRSSRRARKD